MQAAVGKKSGIAPFALAIIICLGSLLHLIHIDTFSFWIDESLTPLRSSYPLLEILSNRITIQEWESQDSHLPFYYLVISFTSKLFGTSEFAYRFPSSLFAVLSIPLMYQLGRRVTGRKSAGLLAALWIAINPLVVWYAQEARMYTLLNLFGIVLMLILWQAMQSQDESVLWRWFGIYLLVALLSVTTHLTTVFYVAGHLLIWAYFLWRFTKQGRWIIMAGMLAGLVGLWFLPILVPRLFTPAESGFSDLPPLTVFQDLFRGYSRGITTPPFSVFNDLMRWGYGLILLCGVVFMLLRRRWNVIALVGLSLLMPAIGIIIASEIKPMYQGVRHIMLGSSAFLLLLAIGADGLFALDHQKGSAKPLRWGGGFLAILIVLLGSAASLYTLYTDPAVAKDNLRDMVQKIEASAGENDLVIYSDAVLMLTHNYYRSREDLNVTAVPAYALPVDDGAFETLDQIAAAYDRIWFVPSTPADRRDPDGEIQKWLLEHAVLRQETWFDGKSAEFKVEVYQTNTGVGPADESAGLATTSSPASLTADPRFKIPEAGLRLVDISLDSVGPDSIWLNTAWQGDAPDSNLILLFILQGEDDWHWVRQEAHLFHQSEKLPNQPIKWSAAQLNHVEIFLPRPTGLAPGPYKVLLDSRLADGSYSGNLAEVGVIDLPLEIADAASPNSQPIQYENGVQLSQVAILDPDVKPGHLFPAYPVWQATGQQINVAELTYDLQLFSEEGELIYESSGRPGTDWIDEWQPEGLYRGNSAVLIPASAEPGIYDLRWRLHNGETPIHGRKSGRLSSQEWQPLGQVTVNPFPFVADPPAVDQELNAHFEGFGHLYGSTATVDGDRLKVDLVWQPATRTELFYLVFVHVVDPQTNDIVAERFWIPAEGVRPTTGWRPDEFIVDTHWLDMSGVATGSYLVRVGLSSPETFERPKVTQDGQTIPEGHAELGLIENE